MDWSWSQSATADSLQTAWSQHHTAQTYSASKQSVGFEEFGDAVWDSWGFWTQNSNAAIFAYIQHVTKIYRLAISTLVLSGWSVYPLNRMYYDMIWYNTILNIYSALKRWCRSLSYAVCSNWHYVSNHQFHEIRQHFQRYFVGRFISAGWQVTLRDPIWQVISRPQ